MNPTTQIAAEAREPFKDLVIKVAGRMAKDRCVPLPEVWEPELDRIIQTVIEKAVAPWRDAAEAEQRLKESRAAHASEEQDDIDQGRVPPDLGCKPAHASEQGAFWRMIKDPNDETPTAWGIEKDGKPFIRQLTKRQASAIICAYIESQRPTPATVSEQKPRVTIDIQDPPALDSEPMSMRLKPDSDSVGKDDYVGINKIIDQGLSQLPDAGISKTDHVLRTAVIDAYELGKSIASPPSGGGEKWTVDHTITDRFRICCNGEILGRWLTQPIAHMLADAHNATLQPSDNQRLYDLVRYCRSELHQAKLITDEEYASLVATGSEAARRLENYVQSRDCGEDTKRLDWLLSSKSRKHGIRIEFNRERIDAAMKSHP